MKLGTVRNCCSFWGISVTLRKYINQSVQVYSTQDWQFWLNFICLWYDICRAKPWNFFFFNVLAEPKSCWRFIKVIYWMRYMPCFFFTGLTDLVTSLFCLLEALVKVLFCIYWNTSSISCLTCLLDMSLAWKKVMHMRKDTLADNRTWWTLSPGACRWGSLMTQRWFRFLSPESS